MKVYHTSNVIVSNPDVLHSREFLDFGKGFYVTTMKDQAIKYAQRFIRRGRKAYLNTYEFSEDLSEWNILTFDSYNKEWLDFVAACRDGKPSGNYDMVVGGIANDKVILTLDMYFAGSITQEVALKRLTYEKPNIQYCIRSEKMLNECITYIESQQL